MGLTNKKEEQLKQQPIIESKVFKSKSGQFIVFQTTMTEIKPVAYMQKVLENDPVEPELASEEDFVIASA